MPPDRAPDRSPDRLRGKVMRTYPERGFGFIRCLDGIDAGIDYFFHATGLDDCEIDQLEEGSTVTFEPRHVAKGKRAEHVQRTA